MITRKITIDDIEYTLSPLTRRQFRAINPVTETTIEETLAIALTPEQADTLENLPMYVSKQLFEECLDLSTSGKAEKNL